VPASVASGRRPSPAPPDRHAFDQASAIIGGRLSDRQYPTARADEPNDGGASEPAGGPIFGAAGCGAPGLKFAAAPRTIGVMLLARHAAAAVILGSCCVGTGCQIVPTGGMADRCADIMRRAYPGADINVTKSKAAATSLTRIVAHVEGDRTDLPPHPPIARHLAVECQFDNNILTGFRWTAGPN
jgi:hypothetical protein